LVLSLASLFLFGIAQNTVGVMAGYLAIQASASIAQAGQQGLIPAVVNENRRGIASGLKGFMDLTGAMLGFVLLGQLLGSGQSLPAIGAIAAILVVAYLLATWLTPEDKVRSGNPIRTRAIPLRDIFRVDLAQQSAFLRLILARFLFNHPIIGPDEKIYFGAGCATNCGVVGADNFGFEWLTLHPEFCDVPAQDVKPAGRNYEARNVLGDIRETVQTGAYVPFSIPTTPGQVIQGNVKCNGAILRCDLDGSNLEVVAWGLRNPYGLAFRDDGQLFATEHGMDERGARYIVDDPDDFYEIRQGEWYGWPDFASGIRLDDPYWGEAGHGREPVLAEFPNPYPPKPFVSFQTHAAANGFDFCWHPEFGFEGDAFVACFGDLAPITTITKAVTPAGFKVVRVDMESGRVFDFAVNKMTGPASKLPHDGFERPSHCQFGPDGNLYIVDFGIIHIAPERGAIRQQIGTGTLWRIRRTDGPRGLVPPKPTTVSVYLLQGLALAAVVVGGAIISARLIKKLRGNGNGRG
jgi:hypothetical protein